MRKSLKKVVICAAGKGTRMLPITSVIPKEMLPIINKPVIQYVLEEAIVPGIEEVILVINSRKSIILKYIKSSNSGEFNKLMRKINLKIVYQQRGCYGSACPLVAAQKYLENDPFLVLFADSFGMREHSRIEDMIKVYSEHGNSVICLVPATERHKKIYGIAKIKNRNGMVVVKNIIEKPGRSVSGSIFAAPNGYLLTKGFFSSIKSLKPGKGEELGLPNAVNHYCKKNIVQGAIFEGPFFEVGNRLDFVDTQVRMSAYNKGVREIKKE